MTALVSTPRIDALNDRLNDLFGEILHGRANSAECAEFERVRLALQAALVGEEPTYPDARYPDLDVRYDSAIAALRDAWRDEQHASTDHLYPSIDAEASDEWYESQTDIPY